MTLIKFRLMDILELRILLQIILRGDQCGKY